MNNPTVIRTSIHTCFVTREAIEFIVRSGNTDIQMLPIPSSEYLVSIKTIEPAHRINGGHIRAVFELTQRVDSD